MTKVTCLLLESQKKLLKLLKPKSRENENGENEPDQENESTNLYTPTKSVRINNLQEIDPNASRNQIHALKFH